MPYILVIVLLCILSLYEFLDIKTVGILVGKNTKLWFYLICAVSLWLIAALRFETGRDWQGYVQFFEILYIQLYVLFKLFLIICLIEWF